MAAEGEEIEKPSGVATRATAIVIARARIRVLFPTWTDDQVAKVAEERWRDFEGPAAMALDRIGETERQMKRLRERLRAEKPDKEVDDGHATKPHG